MASMRRIRRRCRTVKSVLRPGTLILTDFGLLGRVMRLIDSPGVASPTQIEIADADGGVTTVSSRDIRLVYR
jgi:hypothetical protein